MTLRLIKQEEFVDAHPTPGIRQTGINEARIDTTLTSGKMMNFLQAINRGRNSLHTRLQLQR